MADGTSGTESGYDDKDDAGSEGRLNEFQLEQKEY
jgi:hypothetical protein